MRVLFLHEFYFVKLGRTECFAFGDNGENPYLGSFFRCFCREILDQIVHRPTPLQQTPIVLLWQKLYIILLEYSRRKDTKRFLYPQAHTEALLPEQNLHEDSQRLQWLCLH